MPQELTAGGNALAVREFDSPVQEASIWSSLRNCWLVIPLLYFSTNGAFLTNGEFVSTTGFAGPSDADSLLSRAQQGGIWGIAVLLMYPYYRTILRAFHANKALSTLITFTMISVIWSPGVLDSIRRATLLALTASFAYFLAEKFKPQELMRLIYFTGCLAAVGSLITIAISPRYGFMSTGEWKGIFGHKNDLGIYLCFMLSPILFLPAKATMRNVAGIICALVGVVLIIGSQSRGAWIVAAALFAYVAVLKVIHRMATTRDAIAFSATLAGIITVIGLLIYENYAAITYFMGKDPSLTNRGLIWNAVLGCIAERPILGYGYGGFWRGIHGESIKVISAVGVNISHAHNGYLNLTLQTGLVGLGLFVFVLLVACRNAFVTIYSRRIKSGEWYGAILLMTVVASSDESFLMNYNAITTILFMIACVGLHNIVAGEEAG